MTVNDAAAWLFVPGDRPERFGKAAETGAHEVIIDLEDAVGTAGKEQARANTVSWLNGPGSAWVRVNAVSTPWYEEDVKALTQTAGLRGLVVPKAEGPEQLRALGDGLPKSASIVALVESARGILDVVDIARCPAVARLAFGSLDFALDVDADDESEICLFARSSLVLASRVAGLAAPLDGVTTDISSPEAAARAAQWARRQGFGGKLCIHPAQVEPVQRAFAPSTEELRWAERILASSHGSGVKRGPDGLMIDKPVLDRARRILGTIPHEAAEAADASHRER